MNLPKDVYPIIAKHVQLPNQPPFRLVNKQFSEFEVTDKICCHPPLPSELFDLFKLHLNGKLRSKAFGLLRFDFVNDTYIIVDRTGDDKIVLNTADLEEIPLTDQEALNYLKEWQLDYSDVNTWFTVYLVFSKRKICSPKLHECFITFIRQNLLVPTSNDIVEISEYLEDIGRILVDDQRGRLIDDFSRDIGQGPGEVINTSIQDFMKWLDLWISRIEPGHIETGYMVFWKWIWVDSNLIVLE